MRWLLTGQAPFHVDLVCALDDTVRAGGTFTPIASDVPLVAGADGSFTYEWDTSKLEGAHIYYVRVTVTDATSQTVFSDSRAGVTVFHPGDQPELGGLGQDLSIATPSDEGGCAVAATHDMRASWIVFLAAGLAFVVVASLRRAP